MASRAGSSPREGRLDVLVPGRRPHGRLHELRGGVDEDEPDDVVGVGPGVRRGDQPAEGVAHEHVGAGDTRGGQQRVDVDRVVAGRGRLRDAGGTTGRAIGPFGVRTVVGAHARRASGGLEDCAVALGHRVGRIGGRSGLAPDIAGVAGAGDEQDGRRTRAAALQVQLATVTDADQAGDVLVGGHDDRRLGRRGRPSAICGPSRRTPRQKEATDGRGARDLREAGGAHDGAARHAGPGRERCPSARPHRWSLPVMPIATAEHLGRHFRRSAYHAGLCATLMPACRSRPPTRRSPTPWST